MLGDVRAAIAAPRFRPLEFGGRLFGRGKWGRGIRVSGIDFDSSARNATDASDTSGTNCHRCSLNTPVGPFRGLLIPSDARNFTDEGGTFF